MSGIIRRVSGVLRRAPVGLAPLLMVIAFYAAFLGLSSGRVLAAPGDWPTYNHDATRTGFSPDQTALGTVELAWTSASLDGRFIYAQPLVVGERVIAATEGNSLFALEAATGEVVWGRNLGTPVPKSDLPGGNIDPSGITSTPVVDVAGGTIYAVAFVRDGGPHHELFAVDLTTGTVDWHRTVDPPGLSPLVEQQRAALALSAGRVYVAYGGLYGDIGQYKGAVVSSAADGSGALTSYVLPASRRGGIWNPAGPVVDSGGDLWVITGNTISQTTFDYGNALLRLSPTLSLLDYFTPTDWATLNARDLDLCTLAPVLLPDGGVLIIGKAGKAYLLDSADLGHVSTAPVIASIGGAPYGSAAVMGTRVFVPGASWLKALDISTNQIKVAWTVSGASSSPTIAAGYVWSMGYAGLLRAVDPSTGAVVYTKQFVKPPSRFTSLAAAGGWLFVPDGTKITALSLHGAPVVASVSPGVGAPEGGTVVTIDGKGFTNESAVTFGGVPATTSTVLSPTRITATAPAHDFGTVDVVVTTVWGSSATTGSADDFTYVNRYEQTDPHIVKTGLWYDFSKPGLASADSYGRSATSGASATIYFEGTQIDWIAMTGSTPGKVDVYLDDEFQVTLDLYSSPAHYNQRIWSSGALPAGKHTLGLKRSDASLTTEYITLDAVDIWGTIAEAPPVPTAIATVSPASGLTSGGTSVTIAGTSLSGATSVTFGGDPATGVAVNGAGTALTCVTPAHAAGPVDVVVVTPAGTATATDAFTYLEPGAGPTRYEQTDPHIVKTGLWYDFSKPGLASADSYGRSATSGASATIYFEGTQIDWIAMTGSTPGKVDVYLDDEFQVTLDLYSSPAHYNQRIWSSGALPAGKHTLGLKRSDASLTTEYITLDAVDIWGTIADPPTRYEQTDPHIVKTGLWYDFSKPGLASADSYGRSATSGASATIYFEGTRLDYIAMTGSTPGIVDIYLDDVYQTTIDLQSSPAKYDVNVWSSGDIADTSHKVEFRRSASSDSGEYLTLDAVDTWGTINSGP